MASLNDYYTNAQLIRFGAVAQGYSQCEHRAAAKEWVCTNAAGDSYLIGSRGAVLFTPRDGKPQRASIATKCGLRSRGELYVMTGR